MATIKKLLGMFICYMCVTWANKVIAILLLVLGGLPTLILEHDITALVGLSIIAIPLFFTNRNWII